LGTSWRISSSPGRIQLYAVVLTPLRIVVTQMRISKIAMNPVIQIRNVLQLVIALLSFKLLPLPTVS